MLAERLYAHIFDIHAIDTDFARVYFVETRNQRAQGGLTNTRSTNQGNIFTNPNIKRDMLQNVVIAFFILEADIFQYDIAMDVCQINRICRILDIWFEFKHFHKALKPSQALLVEPRKVTKPLDWFD